MPTFSVLVRTLEDESDNLNTYKKELSQYADRLKRIRNNLPVFSEAGGQIKRAIDKSVSNTRTLESDMKKLCSCLNAVGQRYVSVEAKSVEWGGLKVLRAAFLISAATGAFGLPIAAWQIGKYVSKNIEVNDVLNVISEFGPVGCFASVVGKSAKLLTGEKLDMGDFAYIGEKASKGLEKTSKLIDNFTDRRQLFGLEAKEVGKNAKAVGKTAKTITRWAKISGVVFTAYSKYYDNFVNVDPNDANNSAERKAAETVTETVVDIAIGKGIEVGLTAVAGALLGATPVGWGAVAIGVGAVAVKWCADKICEKTTGKDLTENVSDFILDNAKPFFEKVGKNAKRAFGGGSGGGGGR